MTVNKVIFATENEHKLREIRQILKEFGWEIISMREAGIEADIVEDGESFEENALIKARAVYSRCGGIVMADDSGLEIDWLSGEPGVLSARWGGYDTPYEVKNRMILERMMGVPRKERSARFVCAAAAVVPGHEPLVLRRTMEGYIGDAPAGAGGFGYDPIFYVPDPDCSTAELSMEEKNLRSHRGKALRAMGEKIRELTKAR